MAKKTFYTRMEAVHPLALFIPLVLSWVPKKNKNKKKKKTMKPKKKKLNPDNDNTVLVMVQWLITEASINLDKNGPLS